MYTQVERQKGLTTSHLHVQVDPFASKLTIRNFCSVGNFLESMNKV